MKGKDAVTGALIVATLLTSGVAVEYRSAPMLFGLGYDRTALRHVDDDRRKWARTKGKRRLLDPRSDDERAVDQLDARIRILWAKVERLESTLLGTQQEEEKASA